MKAKITKYLLGELSESSRAMPEQKSHLESANNQWMEESKEEQVDDLCVIGIRV